MKVQPLYNLLIYQYLSLFFDMPNFFFLPYATGSNCCFQQGLSFDNVLCLTLNFFVIMYSGHYVTQTNCYFDVQGLGCYIQYGYGLGIDH